MKKYLTRLIVLLVTAVILSTSALFVTAAAEYPRANDTVTASDSDSPTKGDVLVWKYRTYNGVLQKRRWNLTRNEWYDAYWINV